VDPQTAVDNPLLALLDEVGAACAEADRGDLGARVAARRARIADPFVAVVVAGEYKTGKSSLVNVLVGADLCPVDEDIATAVPTIVRYAPETTISVRRAAPESPESPESPDGPEDPDGPDGDQSGVTVTESIAGDLATYVSDRPASSARLDEPPGGAVQAVIVGMPSPLLREGLVLVDTPGVGGLVSQYTVATLASLSMADAALFVSDATQEYTAPELDFLASARRACPIIVPVLTKIDIAAEWDKIRHLDQLWLEQAGLDSPVLATSAALALRGQREQRRDLEDESGFAPLLATLRGVLQLAREAMATDAAAEVHGVIAQLAAPVRAERDAIENPLVVVAGLERAEERGRRLDSDRAEWLTILDDGLSDLEDRVEVEVSARLRTVAADARQTMATSDPAVHWDEFEAALGRQVASEMAAVSATLLDATQVIAQRIAEHFAEHEAAIAPALTTTLAPALAVEASVGLGIATKFEWRGVLLEAGWGGLEGLAAIGSILTFTSISLFNPFALAIGVFVGGKTLRQARKRELQRRREQAIDAIDRYLDDASQAADRQWRASLRTIRRELRTAYQRRAEELHRSTRDSLDGARRSVVAADGDRAVRLGQLAGRLARLQQLDDRATGLGLAATATTPPPPPPGRAP
jgi:hypothetical protein